ncbi:MAG TPA: DUF2953 domain-containing protein, partial [Clostridia bacterium]|nr:DUF2953 domain-containing protein [Clostridia bacterium]
LYVNITVSKGDAAQTAIEYGKICSQVFPAMGFICSNMKVKKYDLNISPDYLANKSKAKLYAYLSVVPIAITNAAVVLAVKLLFNVLLKILFKNMKSQKINQTNKTERRS